VLQILYTIPQTDPAVFVCTEILLFNGNKRDFRPERVDLYVLLTLRSCSTGLLWRCKAFDLLIGDLRRLTPW
jgi:hypothetical protein